MSKKKSQFRWNSDQPLQFCGSLQREESANTQHWEININLILEEENRMRVDLGPMTSSLANWHCVARGGWLLVWEKNLHREHTRQDLPGAMQPNRATFSQSLSLTSSSWIFEDFLQKKLTISEWPGHLLHHQLLALYTLPPFHIFSYSNKLHSMMGSMQGGSVERWPRGPNLLPNLPFHL